MKRGTQEVTTLCADVMSRVIKVWKAAAAAAAAWILCTYLRVCMACALVMRRSSIQLIRFRNNCTRVMFAYCLFWKYPSYNVSDSYYKAKR